MTWQVQLGINPIGWRNDDLPELGADTSLQTIISEGAKIGYAGFELGNAFPKDKKELKDVLAQYKLACVSGWYSGYLAEESVPEEQIRCRQHMEKLAYNNCKVVVYGEVAGAIQGQRYKGLTNRPKFASSFALAKYAEKLNAFGAFLRQEFNLTLAYHHHMGAYIQTPSDIDALMKETDKEQVGLLFDTGHAWFGGANSSALLVGLLQRHIHRVVHVHCKDVRASIAQKAHNEDWSFLQSVLAGVFTVPGDGAVSFPQVLHLLHTGGYKGWLVVEAEQDPIIAPPYIYASKGFNTLKELVGSLSKNSSK